MDGKISARDIISHLICLAMEVYINIIPVKGWEGLITSFVFKGLSPGISTISYVPTSFLGHLTSALRILSLN